ncbi:MAG: outer rane adhesin like protein, partial [Planctomycetaceae bacterium]|nr:outer rane adhesin like protein [Planctomycetaceae bacterium]
PVAMPDTYAATEDTVLTVTAASGVLANDTDIDGDLLTAILDVGPQHGTLTLNPNGSFTYTPGLNVHGADTFIYHANDGTGNSAPTVVTLTVASVNDAPPVALPDTYTGTEDTVLTVNAANGVLVNDTDVDGDPLTAIVDIGPTHGTLTLNPNGSFVYTPNANFNGVDTFTYHANDGTSNSPPTIVTLTIAAVNDAPPVAMPDSYATNEDAVLTVNAANGVLVNDTDIDGNTLTAILDVGPTHGTLSLNPNGSFTYTPSSNFNGVDTFLYHANDGTSNSAPTVVTLTVAAVNDGPPVAVPDSYTTSQGSPVVAFAPTGVLANDTDPDGDTLTAELDNGPANGTLTLNPDGSFIYTPTSTFSGGDSFTYHANDGTANSNTVTVTLTVTNTNDAPLSVNDAYFINEDSVLTVAPATGVLANDTDPDGDPLTAVLVTPPSNGTVVLNSDGSFVYTPNADFNGSDSFTYRANDGSTNGNIATVNLTVNSQGEAPIIVTSAGTTEARKHRKTVIDPAIDLIDTDSPSFSGGHLDVAIVSGLGRRDTLGFSRVGANRGLVNARRGQLRIGHEVIGSVTGGLHGSPLHIEFNSNATQDRVQVVMQNVIFRGTGSQPGPRTISFRITDDTGLESNTATKSVNVT